MHAASTTTNNKKKGSLQRKTSWTDYYEENIPKEAKIEIDTNATRQGKNKSRNKNKLKPNGPKEAKIEIGTNATR
jgi:hypothetical protein